MQAAIWTSLAVRSLSQFSYSAGLQHKLCHKRCILKPSSGFPTLQAPLECDIDLDDAFPLLVRSIAGRYCVRRGSTLSRSKIILLDSPGE